MSSVAATCGHFMKGMQVFDMLVCSLDNKCHGRLLSNCRVP